MNFKKILPMIPAILAPYLLLFILYMIFSCSPILEKLFYNNGLLLVAVFFLYLFVALVLVILTSVFAVKNQWDCVSLAKTVFIIKLIQIPAYLAIFVLGALLFISIFTIPFTLVMAFVDFLTVAMTGILGLATVINANKKNKSENPIFTICSVLQFVFCIDIIASAVLYFKSKKEFL